MCHLFQSITKGLAMFSDTVTSTLTGTKPASTAQQRQQQQANAARSKDQTRPGIVTIVDFTVGSGQVNKDKSCFLIEILMSDRWIAPISPIYFYGIKCTTHLILLNIEFGQIINHTSHLLCS